MSPAQLDHCTSTAAMHKCYSYLDKFLKLRSHLHGCQGAARQRPAIVGAQHAECQGARVHGACHAPDDDLLELRPIDAASAAVLPRLYAPGM